MATKAPDQTLQLLRQLPPVNQAEIDIMLHEVAVRGNRFNGRGDKFLRQDMKDKRDVLKALWKGTDRAGAARIKSILNRDIGIHRDYLAMPEHPDTGTHEWHRTWIDIYRNWIDIIDRKANFPDMPEPPNERVKVHIPPPPPPPLTHDDINSSRMEIQQLYNSGAMSAEDFTAAWNYLQQLDVELQMQAHAASNEAYQASGGNLSASQVQYVTNAANVANQIATGGGPPTDSFGNYWNGSVWVSPEGNTYDPDEGFWRSPDRDLIYVNDMWIPDKGSVANSLMAWEQSQQQASSLSDEQIQLIASGQLSASDFTRTQPDPRLSPYAINLGGGTAWIIDGKRYGTESEALAALQAQQAVIAAADEMAVNAQLEGPTSRVPTNLSSEQIELIASGQMAAPQPGDEIIAELRDQVQALQEQAIAEANAIIAAEEPAFIDEALIRAGFLQDENGQWYASPEVVDATEEKFLLTAQQASAEFRARRLGPIEQQLQEEIRTLVQNTEDMIRARTNFDPVEFFNMFSQEYRDMTRQAPEGSLRQRALDTGVIGQGFFGGVGEGDPDALAKLIGGAVSIINKVAEPIKDGLDQIIVNRPIGTMATGQGIAVRTKPYSALDAVETFADVAFYRYPALVSAYDFLFTALGKLSVASSPLGLASPVIEKFTGVDLIEVGGDIAGEVAKNILPASIAEGVTELTPIGAAGDITRLAARGTLGVRAMSVARSMGVQGTTPLGPDDAIRILDNVAAQTSDPIAVIGVEQSLEQTGYIAGRTRETVFQYLTNPGSAVAAAVGDEIRIIAQFIKDAADKLLAPPPGNVVHAFSADAPRIVSGKRPPRGIPITAADVRDVLQQELTTLTGNPVARANQGIALLNELERVAPGAQLTDTLRFAIEKGNTWAVVVNAVHEYAYKNLGIPQTVRGKADELLDALRKLPDGSGTPSSPVSHLSQLRAATRNQLTSTPTLPRDLAGAKPRYKNSQLNFESDIDKAAYITAQTRRSKRDQDYVDFVRKATGWTEEQVREHGARVRDVIPTLQRDLDQTYHVPRQPTPGARIPTPEPIQTQSQYMDDQAKAVLISERLQQTGQALERLRQQAAARAPIADTAVAQRIWDLLPESSKSLIRSSSPNDLTYEQWFDILTQAHKESPESANELAVLMMASLATEEGNEAAQLAIRQAIDEIAALNPGGKITPLSNSAPLPGTKPTTKGSRPKTSRTKAASKAKAAKTASGAGAGQIPPSRPPLNPNGQAPTPPPTGGALPTPDHILEDHWQFSNRTFADIVIDAQRAPKSFTEVGRQVLHRISNRVRSGTNETKLFRAPATDKALLLRAEYLNRLHENENILGLVSQEFWFDMAHAGWRTGNRGRLHVGDQWVTISDLFNHPDRYVDNMTPEQAGVILKYGHFFDYLNEEAVLFGNPVDDHWWIKNIGVDPRENEILPRTWQDPKSGAWKRKGMAALGEPEEVPLESNPFDLIYKAWAARRQMNTERWLDDAIQQINDATIELNGQITSINNEIKTLNEKIEKAYKAGSRGPGAGSTATQDPNFLAMQEQKHQLENLVAELSQMARKKENPGTALKIALEASNLLRQLNATADLSFLGVQGLLGLAQDPYSFARATAYAFSHFFGRASEGARLAYIRRKSKILQIYLQHGGFWSTSNNLGEFFSSRLLQPQGRLDPRQLFNLANNTFSEHGNHQRLEMFENAYNLMVERKGAENISWKEVSDLVSTVNKISGVGAHQGTLLERFLFFAPRFLRGQIGLAADALTKDWGNSPLEFLPLLNILPGPLGKPFRASSAGSLARQSLLNFLVMGSTLTVVINEALGTGPEDYLDVIKESFTTGDKYLNPNFMRIRYGGRDYSVFGQWDTMLRMATTAVHEGPFAALDQAVQFKASPLVRDVFPMLGDIWSGLNQGGWAALEPTNKNLMSWLRGMGNFALNAATPISFQNIVLDWQDGPFLQVATTTALDIIGIKNRPLTASEKRNILLNSLVLEAENAIRTENAAKGINWSDERIRLEAIQRAKNSTEYQEAYWADVQAAADDGEAWAIRLLDRKRVIDIAYKTQEEFVDKPFLEDMQKNGEQYQANKVKIDDIRGQIAELADPEQIRELDAAIDAISAANDVTEEQRRQILNQIAALELQKNQAYREGVIRSGSGSSGRIAEADAAAIDDQIAELYRQLDALNFESSKPLIDLIKTIRDENNLQKSALYEELRTIFEQQRKHEDRVFLYIETEQLIRNDTRARLQGIDSTTQNKEVTEFYAGLPNRDRADELREAERAIYEKYMLPNGSIPPDAWDSINFELASFEANLGPVDREIWDFIRQDTNPRTPTVTALNNARNATNKADGLFFGVDVRFQKEPSTLLGALNHVATVATPGGVIIQELAQQGDMAAYAARENKVMENMMVIDQMVDSILAGDAQTPTNILASLVASGEYDAYQVAGTNSLLSELQGLVFNKAAQQGIPHRDFTETLYSITEAAVRRAVPNITDPAASIRPHNPEHAAALFEAGEAGQAAAQAQTQSETPAPDWAPTPSSNYPAIKPSVPVADPVLEHWTRIIHEDYFGASYDAATGILKTPGFIDLAPTRKETYKYLYDNRLEVKEDIIKHTRKLLLDNMDNSQLMLLMAADPYVNLALVQDPDKTDSIAARNYIIAIDRILRALDGETVLSEADALESYKGTILEKYFMPSGSNTNPAVVSTNRRIEALLNDPKVAALNQQIRLLSLEISDAKITGRITTTGPASIPQNLLGVYSQQDVNTLYDAARAAGFTGQALDLAVAVAIAESRSEGFVAENRVNENSIGPWQINLDAHWDKVPGATMAEKTAWLKDPFNAAKIAFQVSNGGTDFSPWTVTHASRGAPANTVYRALTSGATEVTRIPEEQVDATVAALEAQRQQLLNELAQLTAKNNDKVQALRADLAAQLGFAMPPGDAVYMLLLDERAVNGAQIADTLQQLYLAHQNNEKVKNIIDVANGEAEPLPELAAWIAERKASLQGKVSNPDAVVQSDLRKIFLLDNPVPGSGLLEPGGSTADSEIRNRIIAGSILTAVLGPAATLPSEPIPLLTTSFSPSRSVNDGGGGVSGGGVSGGGGGSGAGSPGPLTGRGVHPSPPQAQPRSAAPRTSSSSRPSSSPRSGGGGRGSSGRPPPRQPEQDFLRPLENIGYAPESWEDFKTTVRTIFGDTRLVTLMERAFVSGRSLNDATALRQARFIWDLVPISGARSFNEWFGAMRVLYLGRIAGFNSGAPPRPRPMPEIRTRRPL